MGRGGRRGLRRGERPPARQRPETPKALLLPCPFVVGTVAVCLKYPQWASIRRLTKGEPAMATPEARVGEVVDVRPLGSALASSPTATLPRAEQGEGRRRVGPAGKEIAEHKAKGEIVVHCLEGRVVYTAFGKTHNLEAGKLLYLPTGEPHSVKGVEDASLLLTILLPKH